MDTRESFDRARIANSPIRKIEMIRRLKRLGKNELITMIYNLTSEITGKNLISKDIDDKLSLQSVSSLAKAVIRLTAQLHDPSTKTERTTT